MKVRDARRLSARLYRFSRIDVDIWSYAIHNGFTIKFSTTHRYYLCRFALDGVRYVRAHRCAWRLAVIIYDMASTRHADFQGTLVNQPQQRVLGILETVKHQLHEDFPIRTAPNYGKPSVLTRPRRDAALQANIGDVIRDAYGPTMLHKVENNWVHSGEVSDPALIAPGFNKLGLKPLRPLDKSVAAVMILQQMIRHKKEYGLKKHEVDLTAPKLAAAPSNLGTAAGILPVQAVKGVMCRTVGKKADMHPSAVAVNIANRISREIPRAIPYKVFLKGEVIKRGKAVRGIQNESLANYEILSLSEPSRPKVRLGNAIGMGGHKKTFAAIFVVWYIEYHRHTGADWHAFVSYLEEQGAHESDKVAWEASTNITDCIVRLVMLLNEKTFKTPDCKRLYVAAVTDSHFPFVYLHKEQFQCPGRVPSGTFYTSTGNTERHRSLNDWMCYYVRSHKYKLGDFDCGCPHCAAMRGHEAFGNEITPLQLGLREKAFILGDDYLAVSWGPENDSFFDMLMDNTFGTETKTERKEFFEDAEFLRKRFRKGEENTITWYRDPERVLAKIYHGDFLCTPQRAAEALTAYKYEAGDNELLVDCITKIYELVEPLIAEPLDMSRFADKRPLLKEVTQFRQFGYEDICNYQGQFAQTIENVLLENKRETG